MKIAPHFSVETVKKTGPSRRDVMKIAPHFSVGLRFKRPVRPGGTL
jgi:acyl dehydratase